MTPPALYLIPTYQSYLETLADEMVYLRQRRGLSQHQLAEECGTTKTLPTFEAMLAFIERFERGDVLRIDLHLDWLHVRSTAC